MTDTSADRGRSARGGFTMLEILVVVIVIIALVAVTVPAVSSARERGKAALCQNNMRQMWLMVTQFASSHDNRGPGRDCHVPTPAPSGDTVAWWQVLNAEVLDRGKIDWSRPSAGMTPYGIAGGHSVIAAASPRTLSCPNFIRVYSPSGADIYNYSFAINFDVIGGSDSGGSPKCGDFGVYADPKDGGNHDYAYDRYSLGAKLLPFRNDQFMFIESENDVTALQFSASIAYASGTGKVRLGSGSAANYPAYSGGADEPAGPSAGIYDGAGNASFRHPYARRGNFLYFDGRVESLTPKDDILNPRRLGVGLN